jgi:hypothetical protein
MSQKLVYVKKKKIKGKRSEGKRFPHSSWGSKNSFKAITVTMLCMKHSISEIDSS